MIGQKFIYIGWGTYDAFTTCFYYLYADFRYLGVFFGMFVFGKIAETLFLIFNQIIKLTHLFHICHFSNDL